MKMKGKRQESRRGRSRKLRRKTNINRECKLQKRGMKERMKYK